MIAFWGVIGEYVCGKVSKGKNLYYTLLHFTTHFTLFSFF